MNVHSYMRIQFFGGALANTYLSQSVLKIGIMVTVVPAWQKSLYAKISSKFQVFKTSMLRDWYAEL
jgi:hypothetical protein